MEAEREVRMKRLFAATLLLFFLQESSQIISAQTDEVKSLRGLRGVSVVIEDLPSSAKKAGLTKSQLQIDVEVELRKAGIPVLTKDKRWTAPGMPYLYVNVNSTALSGVLKGSYAFNVVVTLDQVVDLGLNRSKGIYAATWDKMKVGGGGKNNIKKKVREIVRDYVNEFINDYLTVNPK